MIRNFSQVVFLTQTKKRGFFITSSKNENKKKDNREKTKTKSMFACLNSMAYISSQNKKKSFLIFDLSLAILPS